jgi:hypothetical protein
MHFLQATKHCLLLNLHFATNKKFSAAVSYPVAKFPKSPLFAVA